MKPASALRLLRWIVLVLLLTGLGRAGAQEALSIAETLAEGPASGGSDE